ncbi:alcohol-forming fatty acyl-CoA reductase [Artemisia annua]|uniref:Fatty acyl-CoA reductase n=1 Tax=Artemisia annua TaxID=35608 RepID=A0A2U1M6D2_ARTAN|nr:alcohol-forming fatty acyl-CoA reductase [Artemisia annua]
MHSEIIGKDLFRAIKENHGANMNIFISEKVTPVAGDIDLENFGVLNSDLFKEMWEQVDVIVNSAAATNFDERYDMAFSTNTLGAKHVSYFVNQCINIKLLLHVSTAFVSGEQSGVILETPLKMNETLNGKNNLDIKEEMKVIQERRRLLADKKANEEAISADMKEFGIQRAKLHGWPNTYVFTKAMGEMLLFDGLRQDVSLVIVRPTIITSTYKEPFPGWIEGVKTIDGIIATYGRGRVSCLLAELSKVLDVIPADMVINAMIVGMVAHTKQPYSKIIYHVGSSTTNPMKVSSFKNYMYDYFANQPLRNRQGNPIIPTTNVTLLNSMSSFQRYMTVRYIMPLKGVKYINIILFRAFNAWYLDADRKIKIMLRLADLYKPYVLINIIVEGKGPKHGYLKSSKL